MTHEKLSPEAQAVWNELDEGTKKTIQKENPFRQERNAAICALRTRGVKIPVLRKITGLGRQQLGKIVPTKKRTQGSFPDRTDRALNDLKTLFEDFLNSASTVINSLQEKGGGK